MHAKNSRASSHWLRQQISRAVMRDPMAASADADRMAQLLVEGCVIAEALTWSGLSYEEIHKAIHSEETSDWLRHGLSTALERETVEGARDALYLAALLGKRRNAIAVGKISPEHVPILYRIAPRILVFLRLGITRWRSVASSKPQQQDPAAEPPPDSSQALGRSGSLQLWRAFARRWGSRP